METISCENARTMLDEKLDGELGERESARLEAHLAECKACRREYEMLQKTHAYLGTFATQVPSELVTGVMDRIAQEPKHRVPLLRRLRPLIALPVAALLCIALLHSPFWGSMMPAKSEADMSIEATDKNNFYADSLGGLGFKGDADGVFDVASPEEIAQELASNAITGTSLTLRFTDERNAVLTHEENGKSENVTYSRQENIITIEKDDQTISFVLVGNTLTPTDTRLLDALLSE